MSADHRHEVDLLRERLGSPLVSISRPGHEASLHLDVGTQQLWLAEHRTDSHGEDWTAASTHDAVTTSFAQGTLIVGGLLSPPIVRVEALVGDRVQRPSPVSQEAWLAIFDGLELPFECIVRGLDDAGTCVQESTLDFPVDSQASVAGRLADARRRFAFGLRHRFGRMPKGTRSYP